MSKSVINIKSLTINIHSGASQRSIGLPPPELLAAMLGGLFGAQEEDEPKDEPKETATGSQEATETAAAPATETAAADAADGTSTGEASEVLNTLASSDIIVFLNSDPRYTQRSFIAISEHFDTFDEDFLRDLLSEAVALGLIEAKVRRADGVLLYKAVASAEASPATAAPVTATAEAAFPELTSANVRSFLQSDRRYTKRTVDSIAKHFGRFNDDPALEDLLDEMESAGDIERTSRRADGAALYHVL